MCAQWRRWSANVTFSHRYGECPHSQIISSNPTMCPGHSYTVDNEHEQQKQHVSIVSLSLPLSLSLSLWSGIVYFLPASVFTYKCTFVRFVRHSNRHGVLLLLLLPVRLATPSNLEAFEKYPFTRRSPRTNVYINASECLLNSHFPFLRLSAGCRIMSQNSSAHCSDASQGGRVQFDLRNTDAPCERSWRIFT